jgi:putative membrane protein
MWASAITAYVHYLSLGTIFATLATELFTLKKDLTAKEGWRIMVADTLYGIAGLAALVTGVLRVLYYAKEPSYYTHQPLFWVKIGLYILVGTLSLYPTFTFLRWIPPLRQDKAPEVSEDLIGRLKTIIRVELAGFSTIPLMASLMARGIGSDWFPFLNS